MQHRIKSAGILLNKDCILLLRVKDASGEYWIPPGGGLEAQDSHTKAALQREFLEEAGIDVTIGELLCVREFLETTRNIYHAEFFYRISEYKGEPHINNLAGLNDEAFIQAIEWISIDDLKCKRTFPTDLTQVVELANSQHYSAHLGSYVQGQNEMINTLLSNN